MADVLQKYRWSKANSYPYIRSSRYGPEPAVTPCVPSLAFSVPQTDKKDPFHATAYYQYAAAFRK